jgi:hypothetical protein
MYRIRVSYLESADGDLPVVVDLKNAIRNGLTRRFPIESTTQNYNPSWMTATFLDPRFLAY